MDHQKLFFFYFSDFGVNQNGIILLVITIPLRDTNTT